jgi:putative endonuclease
MDTRRQFGNKGEGIAEKVLRRKGYKLLARNFRSRFGELDLVMQDKDTLVFVEVKTRINTKYGRPEEAVTPWKLRHIQKTAEYYCVMHKVKSVKMRIEVVAIQMDGDRIENIRIIPVL